MSTVATNSGIASIFVSSTCKDMELYRRAIEDAVRNKAQLACLLSEDWMGGFDDTVQKCKDRVLAAQGFFLLLGYYYGWVPKGEKSITHLEFDCAFDRWKSLPYPPMAVFAPRQDSEADQRLKSEAEKFLFRWIRKNVTYTRPVYRHFDQRSSVRGGPLSFIDTNSSYARMPSLPACSGKAARR